MVKKKKKRNGSRDYSRNLKTGEYEIIVSKKEMEISGSRLDGFWICCSTIQAFYTIRNRLFGENYL